MTLTVERVSEEPLPLLPTVRTPSESPFRPVGAHIGSLGATQRAPQRRAGRPVDGIERAAIVDDIGDGDGLLSQRGRGLGPADQRVLTLSDEPRVGRGAIEGVHGRLDALCLSSVALLLRGAQEVADGWDCHSRENPEYCYDYHQLHQGEPLVIAPQSFDRSSHSLLLGGPPHPFSRRGRGSRPEGRPQTPGRRARPPALALSSCFLVIRLRHERPAGRPTHSVEGGGSRPEGRPQTPGRRARPLCTRPLFFVLPRQSAFATREKTGLRICLLEPGLGRRREAAQQSLDRAVHLDVVDIGARADGG